MNELSSLFQKKDYCKIGKQNNICLNGFSYENGIIYPLYISGEKCSDCIDLLLIFDENKSHYVYIKDFNRLMFNKTKNKNKKCFCWCCLQCFSSENVLTKHKKYCLVIKGKQNVKLGKGSISFKSYSKQLPTPFEIYVGFDCILRSTPSKGIKSSDKNGSNTEKYQDIFLAVLLLFVLVIKGKQNVKLGKGSISFKSYSKQLPTPFQTQRNIKIYSLQFCCCLC